MILQLISAAAVVAGAAFTTAGRQSLDLLSLLLYQTERIPNTTSPSLFFSFAPVQA